MIAAFHLTTLGSSSSAIGLLSSSSVDRHRVCVLVVNNRSSIFAFTELDLLLILHSHALKNRHDIRGQISKYST